MGDLQETTLDLNRIMDAGMDKFRGELKEAAQETDGSPEETITPQPADDASPPEQGVDDEGVDAEGAPTPETDAPGADAAGTRTGDTPDEDKPFRFKSHDEAENGYRHLQSEKTRVEAENVRLKAKLDRTEIEKKEQEKQEANDRELLDYMSERHEDALAAIDELDPDSEEYRKDVSRIWAQKDIDIDAKRRTLAADSPSETEEPLETEDGRQPSDGWAAVADMAREADIDPDDGYFRMICAFAPAEDAEGKPMPMKDQVDWAISETRKYHTKQERQFQARQKEAAVKKSDAHQEENLPLGRSPAERHALELKKPKEVTLNDAVEGALEERRL